MQAHSECLIDGAVSSGGQYRYVVLYQFRIYEKLDLKKESLMANVNILVGAQWGDEGKGKWIDVLASEADIVARFQGGNNAGHTLYTKGQKVVLHQIPSGIFRDDQIAVLGAGVVVNPTELIKEIEKVRQFVKINPDCLWISEKANLITPWHIAKDVADEESSDRPIGTTKRGIGPAYSDKASRKGLRMIDYVRDDSRHSWCESMSQTCPGFKEHYRHHQELWQAFHDEAINLAPFVCDAEHRIRVAMNKGKNILLEGAQGTLLDVNHGTFPYVTSSSTISGGALASLGIPPQSVSKVYGIAKGYVTRVGEGPFPTELDDAVGAAIAKKGQEFGATTGRPRRCGWFDGVAMRYSAAINGFTDLFINKIDVLSGLEEIKIATAYKHPSLGLLNAFPTDIQTLADCLPVYESFHGWSEDLSKMRNWSELPNNAKIFLRRIENFCEVPVTMIGVGPNRDDAIKPIY
jgi:adenylosuccinate synthase